MAIPFAALPPGTRVRVKQGEFPQDPALRGRDGIVVEASDYRTRSLGVVLDGESEVRMFNPGELEVTESLPLPPERETAKRLRALP